MLSIFLVVVSLGVTQSFSCSDARVSIHSKETNGKTRLTTILSGNYTIQALLTLSSPESHCTTVSSEGLIRSYAVKYVIDKANKNENMTRWATLGLQLDDVCRSLPVTMARGIEVVSLHRPNSVCRADFLKCDGTVKSADVKRATAVIGTQMSFTTIPLASLMSLYDIPQVSYAASSRLLSKKELYKSFFRTIPSDTNQISVMLDIFAKFNWNYIFAIGSDDDYGKLGVSDLKREALSRNVCISHDEYIPYQSTKTKSRIQDVVKKIKEAPKATVVVLFCYVDGLGDYILEEAMKENVNRVWLTSEAWNPDAASLNISLKNQTRGLLSVSLKTYPLTHLLNYMEDQIRTDWSCNMWLQNYLENSEFHCNPTGISSDKKTLNGDGCSVAIKDVVDKLRVMPGKMNSLIDSVMSVTSAVSKLLDKVCRNSNTSCHFTKLDMKQLTEQMFNVSFVNEQGLQISFDKVGDPKFVFYTIENLQIINGSHKFIPVGNWSGGKEKEKSSLMLDLEHIKWPFWFIPDSKENKHFPDSRCSKECTPGQAVVGRTGCCWGCQDCTENNYTSEAMAPACKSCTEYEHTDDGHTKCLTTPILWLEISDPAGMSITIISTLGMIIMLIACVVLTKFRKFITPNEPAPHLITLSCVLLILTFVYGPLHITEPTYELCQTRNSVFFLLLMMYSAILLIKSKFMTKYLHKHAEKSFRGNLLIAQLLFLFMLFLLELVSVIAWLYIDTVQVQEFRQAGVHEIWKQCEVSFTAARLVSTFIPCIVLIIATFCAFRERNLEHSFYEPKFLSFTCIALCIIIVAFLPTFKYVVGIYKAIVMAFTMDVFGYTFMACLVLPKVYVAVMRHRRGISEYPVKPGTATKKKEKEEVVRTKSLPTSANERTESSMVETSVATKNHSNSTVTIPNADSLKLKRRGDIEEDDLQVNGYSNPTYEPATEAKVEKSEIIIQDKEPLYDTIPYDSIQHENTRM